MDRIARDHRRNQDSDVCEQKNWDDILAKMTDMNLQASFEKKGRKEEYENHIWREPVWLPALAEALQERMVGYPKEQAADH